MESFGAYLFLLAVFFILLGLVVFLGILYTHFSKDEKKEEYLDGAFHIIGKGGNTLLIIGVIVYFIMSIVVVVSFIIEKFF